MSYRRQTKDTKGSFLPFLPYPLCDAHSTYGGNLYDKYHTKNPLYKFVTRRFLKTLDTIVISLSDIKSLLEVGCGEGYLLGRIAKICKLERKEGIDTSEEIIKKAKVLHPSLKFTVGSCYNLNYQDREFDVVLACEVLEHLKDPNKALSEIKRVANKYCIISVPLEPLWRVCNLARGAYIFAAGNTPGHIQRWSRKGFGKLLNRHFTFMKVYYPLPWQIALCQV